MRRIALGIDIGGTNTEFAFYDRDGECYGKAKIKTANYPTPNEFIAAIGAKIDEMLPSIPKDMQIIGIGVGAPNGNYYRGAIEFAPNLPWKGSIKLADMFGEKFGYPCALTNDANAAALGEMYFGGAKKMKDFLLITLGTGLGSGFVANGRLIYGSDGFAGELGHTTAVIGGRECNCGKKGCLETYVSISGVQKTYKELLVANGLEAPEGKISPKDIQKLAEAGDKIAVETFRYTGELLGQKLADAVLMTSPQAIFYFGGLSNAGDFIFAPAKKAMEESILPIFRNKIDLIKSQAPDSAAIMGACALAWNEFEP